MNLCVYGASSNEINREYIEAVEKLGEKMAKRGHTLIFGAGAGGCMGAAARGVDRAHGDIVGIVPSFFNVDGVLYDHCTKLVETDTMRERKKLLEDYSDAFIIAPGGVGTLDEFFEILTLKQLARHKKAIVLFNINGYYDELGVFMRKLVDENFAQEETLDLMEMFTDIDKMLDYIENYEQPDIVVSDMKHMASEPEKSQPTDVNEF